MTLSVLAWDHPRALRPLRACQAAWSEAGEEPFELATRSLESFGDGVIGADGHDLLLIDHPHVGLAARAGTIAPLDELLDAATLRALADDAVGPSHCSYAYAGTQWAVALDAACQALATGRGRSAPRTWSEVLELAAERAGRVALPLRPQHAISALLSVLDAHGARLGGPSLAAGETLGEAVSLLGKLAAAGPPGAFDWEPPDVLERLAAGALDCVPLTYAYVGYDVDWHDAPSRGPSGAPGSILGGVGAAVASSSREAAGAARLAAWLASAAVQRDLVGPAGGQPASCTAWESADADPLLPAVRRTIERCGVRPRDPWWPAFQRAAGVLLADGLRERRAPSELAAALDDLYRQAREPAS